MAEPELSGLRQERHAKTIEIAQKEVLTCIGKDFLNFTDIVNTGASLAGMLCALAPAMLRKNIILSTVGKKY